MEIEKEFSKKSAEAVERSSVSTHVAVRRLMRIQADEKIQQQLGVCSQRAIYGKMMDKLRLHPFVFSGKKMKDSNIWSVRKR